MPGYALQTKTAISSQIQSMHMDQQINITQRSQWQVWLQYAEQTDRNKPNLSEWLYICNSSATEDLEPLTTLIAPVAIIPRLK